MRGGHDEGSAVAELVMVGGLLVMVFAGVVQVGLVMHVRNVLEAAAAEGARYAAVSGQDEQAGLDRIAELERSALSDEVARDIPCTVTTGDEQGTEVREADCAGEMPLLFVPWGRVHVHVHETAALEPVGG
jgi:Flp pilus assembly protein TadG